MIIILRKDISMCCKDKVIQSKIQHMYYFDYIPSVFNCCSRSSLQMEEILLSALEIAKILICN